MKLARIRTGYCEGSKKGDVGFSQLLHKVTIPKDHDACKLYGSVEDLQQSLATAIQDGMILDEGIEYTMKWLHRNIFSLSSFCFMKAESEDHIFPDNFLKYIEGTIEDMKERVGDAQDFLIYSHKSLLLINEVRIRTREVESRLVGWKRSKEMHSYLYGYCPFDIYVEGMEWLFGRRYLVPRINYYISILNRLSSYFFWAGRYQGLLLNERGVNELEEQYWLGRPQEFTPIIKEGMLMPVA